MFSEALDSLLKAHECEMHTLKEQLESYKSAHNLLSEENSSLQKIQKNLERDHNVLSDENETLARDKKQLEEAYQLMSVKYKRIKLKLEELLVGKGQKVLKRSSSPSFEESPLKRNAGIDVIRRDLDESVTGRSSLPAKLKEEFFLKKKIHTDLRARIQRESLNSTNIPQSDLPCNLPCPLDDEGIPLSPELSILEFPSIKQINLESIAPIRHLDEESTTPIRILKRMENITPIASPNKEMKLPSVVKYNEVIRKKGEREQMHGKSCSCCAAYYRATRPLTEGKKSLESAGGGLQNSIGPLGDGLQDLTTISKHRYLHLPPNTPPGFWDVGFTPNET